MSNGGAMNINGANRRYTNPTINMITPTATNTVQYLFGKK
jgi:hypothetical protein